MTVGVEGSENPVDGVLGLVILNKSVFVEVCSCKAVHSRHMTGVQL